MNYKHRPRVFVRKKRSLVRRRPRRRRRGVTNFGFDLILIIHNDDDGKVERDDTSSFVRQTSLFYYVYITIRAYEKY